MSNEKTDTPTNTPTDAPPPYTAPYPTSNPPYPTGGNPYPPQPYPPQAQPYQVQAQPYQIQGQVYVAGQPNATRTTTTTVIAAQPTTVLVRDGNCPNCRVGYLNEQFTCCGILMAFIFFPLGIICCLLMRHKVCTHCGAMF